MKKHHHPEETVPADLPVADDASAESPSELDALRAERDQLAMDLEQLRDRFARIQAEFDNARKRESRERADFRDFAVSGAVEKFLPILDNFHLALEHAAPNDPLRNGVELIVKQMEEALRSLGVTTVDTVGTPFDPRFHEALESVPSPDLPDHQIITEVRRGYRIKDRLLRPALVRVASNPTPQN